MASNKLKPLNVCSFHNLKMTIIRLLSLSPESACTSNKHIPQINIKLNLTKITLLYLQKYAERFPGGIKAFEELIDRVVLVTVKELPQKNLQGQIGLTFSQDVEITDWDNGTNIEFYFTLRSKNSLTIDNILIYKEVVNAS